MNIEYNYKKYLAETPIEAIRNIMLMEGLDGLFRHFENWLDENDLYYK